MSDAVQINPNLRMWNWHKDDESPKTTKQNMDNKNSGTSNKRVINLNNKLNFTSRSSDS